MNVARLVNDMREAGFVDIVEIEFANKTAETKSRQILEIGKLKSYTDVFKAIQEMSVGNTMSIVTKYEMEHMTVGDVDKVVVKMTADAICDVIY